ncbi:MAG TPA: gamma-glutamyltransferase [bacterium]|nr:gamma-glutamyltransferase [bacterium]
MLVLNTTGSKTAPYTVIAMPLQLVQQSYHNKENASLSANWQVACNTSQGQFKVFFGQILNKHSFTTCFIWLSFVIIFLAGNILAQDVIANRAMVSSAHPVATEVGIDILQTGGNAVDAAMAMAFALSIVEPNASGIGGGGFMLIKMANSNQAVMIDYREMAPGGAVQDYYYQSENSFAELTQDGPYSIGVPGLVACADTVLQKYGSMTLKQILQPAIRLFQTGVVVSENLNSMILDNIEKIIQYPETADIFFKDMLPVEAGDTLKNLMLGNSLSAMAEKGGESFYHGEIGKAIVDGVQQAGGILTTQDLKAYAAMIRMPVQGEYRGYQIVSSSPPSGGGTHLIQLLNMMELFDVQKLGHNSADYIHIFSEAMKIVYADKSLNTADPEFYQIPVDTFLSKHYAQRLVATINFDSARFDYAPKNLTRRESNSTSHLSIVDEAGNIVALTQSINSWFGSGVTPPGTGILLNNHLNDFDSKPGMPNSIEPYKRPTSSIAPTIVLLQGKPFMTLGTPGGTRIISALAQIIINVIDFEMGMDQAIEAPRVHCLHKTLHVEGRIEQNVVQKLIELGHQVKLHADYDNYFGGAQGILIDPISNRLYGAADSRRDGKAIGF